MLALAATLGATALVAAVAASRLGTVGGSGSPGLIVITYTPTAGGSGTVRRYSGIGLRCGYLGLGGGYYIGGGATATYTPGATHNGVTPPSATATVSTKAALLSAIAAAPTNQTTTIKVAGPAAGGAANYASGGFAPPARNMGTGKVVIEAASYNDKFLLEGVPGTGFIDLTGWSGIELRGAEIHQQDTGVAVFARTFVAGSFSNVVIDRCYLRGDNQGLAYNQSGPDITTIDLNGCSNVTITNNVFNRCSRPIGPRGASSNITVQNNSFLRTYNHCLELNQCSNVTIRFNLADGFHPGFDTPSSPGAYEFHADMVLGYINGTMTWSGITYSDNFVVELNDHFRFSFQLENAAAAGASAATGITIERNVHIGGIDNPMFLIAIGGGTVNDNEFHWLDTSSEVSVARIRASGSTLSMSGNITGFVDSGGNSISGTAPTGNGTSTTTAIATTRRNSFAALYGLQTQSDVA